MGLRRKRGGMWGRNGYIKRLQEIANALAKVEAECQCRAEGDSPKAVEASENTNILPGNEGTLVASLICVIPTHPVQLHRCDCMPLWLHSLWILTHLNMLCKGLGEDLELSLVQVYGFRALWKCSESRDRPSSSGESGLQFRWKECRCFVRPPLL